MYILENKQTGAIFGAKSYSVKSQFETPAPAPKAAPVVEAKAEPKAKAPSKAELTKLTKKALDEKALEVGIKLDARKTKDAMIKDFQKEFKAQQK